MIQGTSSTGSSAVEAPIATGPSVEVPHDAEGVVDRARGPWVEPLKTLLSQPSIVVVRQLELMSILAGWEQANKYQLLNPDGALLGYLVEEETSVVGTMSRQLLRTHRPFRALVMAPDGTVLLRIRRPFSWINSRIFVSTPTSSSASAREAKEEMQRLEAPGNLPSSTALTTRSPEAEAEAAANDDGEVIGETQQEWAFMRRRYNHFVARGGDGFEQFGRTDSSFLAWDFTVRDEAGAPVGSISRNFAGLGRELFTDTGQYVLRFEGVVDEPSPRIEAPGGPAGLLSGPSSSSTATTAPGIALQPAASSSSSSSAASERDRDLAERAPSLPLDHRAVLLASAVSASLSPLRIHLPRRLLTVPVLRHRL